MKRYLLLSAVLFFSIPVFSQNNLKPVEGEFGISFAVDGLYNIAVRNWMTTGLENIHTVETGTNYILPSTMGEIVPQEIIFGRYYVTDDMTIRLGLGVNTTNQGTENDFSDETITNTSDSRLKACSWGISAGIEKHIGTDLNRLDPFIGASIKGGGISGIKYEYNEDFDDGTTHIITTENVKYPGGCVFGLNLFAGFNYFFNPRIAIGGGIQWGYNKTKLKGDWTYDWMQDYNGTMSEAHSSGSMTQREGGLGTWGAGVNLSVFFDNSTGTR